MGKPEAAFDSEESELDRDELWRAIGEQDWGRVQKLLTDSGHSIEDVGLLLEEELEAADIE